MTEHPNRVLRQALTEASGDQRRSPEQDVTWSVDPVADDLQADETTRHIRGSSFLVLGRFLALAIHLCTQVLLVRALSKSDFGAFAYALSIIALGKSIAVFGLDKAITRFVPIYQEQQDYGKMFGTIVLMIGIVLSLGVAIVLVVYGLWGFFDQSFVKNQSAMILLLILIVLSPVQALESLLTGMFAIFASPRAIFFRKHLLGPELQLIVVVLLLIFSGSNVYFLAAGYLIAGLLGIVIYAVMLVRTFRERGLLRHFSRANLKIPAREIISFTSPLLISDLVFVLRNSLIIVLLEYFQNTAEVASFRAVLPVARLNGVVYQNFMFLFMPVASRMFARNERAGINHLYWQTAVWIAVISFPIFAITFGLAEPLIILLFGERYASSVVILMLLSVGYYCNCLLGFNGLSLRVFGKVRFIFAVDLIVAVVSLAGSLLLIPRYGALGAAIVMGGTIVAQNILYQIGLIAGTDIKWFPRSHIKVYSIIALGAAILVLMPPGYGSVAVVLLLSMLVFWLNHKSLKIEQAFPEVLRLPLARRILSW
jgi:O-antigen/teichoic acid export membrane protein